MTKRCILNVRDSSDIALNATPINQEPVWGNIHFAEFEKLSNKLVLPLHQHFVINKRPIDIAFIFYSSRSLIFHRSEFLFISTVGTGFLIRSNLL